MYVDKSIKKYLKTKSSEVDPQKNIVSVKCYFHFGFETGGLEPILSPTEKLCTASFVDNFPRKI